MTRPQGGGPNWQDEQANTATSNKKKRKRVHRTWYATRKPHEAEIQTARTEMPAVTRIWPTTPPPTPARDRKSFANQSAFAQARRFRRFGPCFFHERHLRQEKKTGSHSKTSTWRRSALLSKYSCSAYSSKAAARCGRHGICAVASALHASTAAALCLRGHVESVNATPNNKATHNAPPHRICNYLRTVVVTPPCHTGRSEGLRPPIHLSNSRRCRRSPAGPRAWLPVSAREKHPVAGGPAASACRRS